MADRATESDSLEEGETSLDFNTRRIMMNKRRAGNVRPEVEGLECRLALSGLGPGHDGGGHDAVDVDVNDDDAQDAVDNDADDNHRHGDHNRGAVHDNGHWEPKPIGNSSTRPTGPT